LFERLAAGQVRAAITFAGQGAEVLPGLTALLDRRPELDDQLDATAGVLAALVASPEGQASGRFRHGIDIREWIDDPEGAPPAAYLRSCAVSYPLVVVAQLLAWNDLWHLGLGEILGAGGHGGAATGHSQGRLGEGIGDDAGARAVRPPAIVAVTGHSQGLLAALAVAEAPLGPVEGERLARHLEIAFRLGLDLATAASAVPEPDGSGPMAAVSGVRFDRLAALVDEVNAALARPDEAVVVGLVNAPDRMVVSGPPGSLDVLRVRLDDIAAADERARAAGRPPAAPLRHRWEALAVDVPFHWPGLAPALARHQAWLAASHLFPRPDQLALPVLSPVDAHDLRVPAAGGGGDAAAPELARRVARSQFVEPVRWDVTVAGLVAAGADWVLDLGPGVEVARLTGRNLRGRGPRALPLASPEGLRILATPGAAPEGPDLRYADLAPGLVELPDGTRRLDNRYSRATGQPPVVLPGMTPTTADAPLVAAAANAGYTAELAGGGQPAPWIFHERVAELRERLAPGVGIVLNSLFLDRPRWAEQVAGGADGPGLLFAAKRDGAPFVGLTVSAGIPEADEAVALLDRLRAAGLVHNAFKPGTVEQVRQVLAIADAAPRHTVFVHVEGGKAGGHHSYEGLDELLLATYADLRVRPNVVLAVGGGVGTPARAAELLTGRWSRRYGEPLMPVDAVLVGTAAMACAEAAASPQVKAALVGTAGTDRWVPRGGTGGGVHSGRSSLNADIHVTDNAAARAAALLAEVAGDAAAVAARHDEIVAALARTAKPWFGDLESMSYGAVLERFTDLCAIGRGTRYDDGEWGDPTWRSRALTLYRRFAARLAPRLGVPGGAADGAVDLDDPAGALAGFRAAFPAADQTLLHPADALAFVEVCDQPGKPVPFVPVLDAEVRRWYMADALWQAQDARYPADAVFAIPGPEAVAGITRVDEPVAELLARFEQATIDELVAAGVEPVGRDRRTDGGLAPAPLAALARGRNGPLAALCVAPLVVADDGSAAPNPLWTLVVPNDEVTTEVDPAGRLLRLESHPHEAAGDRLVAEATGPTEVTITVSMTGPDLVLRFDSAPGPFHERNGTPTRAGFHRHTLTPTGPAPDGHVSPAGAIEGGPVHVSPGAPTRPAPAGAGAGVVSVGSSTGVSAGGEGGPAPAADERVPFADAARIGAGGFERAWRMGEGDAAAYRAVTGGRHSGVPLDLAFSLAWPALVALLIGGHDRPAGPLAGIGAQLGALVHRRHRVVPGAAWPPAVGEEGLASGRVAEVRNTGSERSVDVVVELRSGRGIVAVVEAGLLVRRPAPAGAPKRYVATRHHHEIVVSGPAELELLTGHEATSRSPGPALAVGDRVPVEIETDSTWPADGAAAHHAHHVAHGRIGPLAVDLDRRGDEAMNPVAALIEVLAPEQDQRRERPRLDLAHATDVAPADMGAFARIGGDHNPLHRSVLAARLAGLERPVVHGMWTAARAAAFVVDQVCAGDAGRLTDWSVRFTAPVSPGAELRLDATRVAVDDGRWRVEVVVRAGDGDGGPDDTVVAMATALVAPPVTALVFVGQGGQRPGLGAEDRSRSRAARTVWDQADAHTRAHQGWSLLDVVERNPAHLRLADGTTVSHPDGVLHRTELAQVALVTQAAAQLADLRAAGALPHDIATTDVVVAGHSLGEYSALLALGVLPLGPALDLVHKRGLAMQDAVARSAAGVSPHRLAAVDPSAVGTDGAALSELVAAVARDTGELAEIVNLNARDRQYVVAGTAGPGGTLAELAARLAPGRTDVVRLLAGIDVPFHSSALAPVVDRLRDHLERLIGPVDHRRLVGRWVPNLVGRPFRLDADFVAEVRARSATAPPAPPPGLAHPAGPDSPAAPAGPPHRGDEAIGPASPAAPAGSPHPAGPDSPAAPAGSPRRGDEAIGPDVPAGLAGSPHRGDEAIGPDVPAGLAGSSHRGDEAIGPDVPAGLAGSSHRGDEAIGPGSPVAPAGSPRRGDEAVGPDVPGGPTGLASDDGLAIGPDVPAGPDGVARRDEAALTVDPADPKDAVGATGRSGRAGATITSDSPGDADLTDAPDAPDAPDNPAGPGRRPDASIDPSDPGLADIPAGLARGGGGGPGVPRGAHGLAGRGDVVPDLGPDEPVGSGDPAGVAGRGGAGIGPGEPVGSGNLAGVAGRGGAGIGPDLPDVPGDPDGLARWLLIELLAHQVARPVRWIDVQDVLLAPVAMGGLGARRQVELGPAHAALLTRLAGLVPRPPTVELLHVHRDRDRVLFADVPDAADDDAPDGDRPGGPAGPATSAGATSPGGAPLAGSSASTTGGAAPSPQAEGPSGGESAVGRGAGFALAPLAAAGGGGEGGRVDAGHGAREAGAAGDDRGLGAGEALRVVLAVQARVRLDQLRDDETLDELFQGVSSRRNQVLIDLGREFELSGTDGVLELPLARLAAEIGDRAGRYRFPGTYLRDTIGAGLTRALGRAGLSRRDALGHLGAAWGLGPGLAEQALVALVLETRPGASARGGPLGRWGDDRPTAVPAGRELLDRAVGVVAEATGLDLRPVSRAGEGGGTVDEAAVRRAGERLERALVGAARQLMTALDRPWPADGDRLAAEPGDGDGTDRDTAARLATLDRELGADRAAAIAGRFDHRRNVRFASVAALARWDLVALHHDALDRRYPPHELRAEAERLAIHGGDPAVAATVAWCAGRARDADRPDVAELLAGITPARPTPLLPPAVRPAVRVADDGQLTAHEVPANPARLTTLITAIEAQTQTQTETATAAAAALRRSREAAPDLSGTVALVTGAGPGSIAAGLVRHLLRGGATVVATTSTPTLGRRRWWREVYRTAAAPGAELHLVPANLASFADIDALVDWLAEPVTPHAARPDLANPPLVPDLVVPFAAMPTAGDATEQGADSETALRVQLLGVERLVSRVAELAGQRSMSAPVTVLLPLSPNHGDFGGDGPYGETKAALGVLARRARSEQARWGRHARIVGVRIGWVRGTGLMGANDLVAELVEERLGVRTFSADEMGWLLAGVCAAPTPEATEIDLTGGLGRVDGLRAALEPLVDELADRAAGQRRRHQLAQALARKLRPDGPPADAAAAAARALPPPEPHAVGGATARAPATAAAGDLDPRGMVVIVGAGELGPCGTGLSREALELAGDEPLPDAAVVELAWLCGLAAFERQGYRGRWIDTATGIPVDEADLAGRYRADVLARVGLRPLEDDGLIDPAGQEVLATVHLDTDVSFEVGSEATARSFLAADPAHTEVRHQPGPNAGTSPGTWTVTRKAGAPVRVPRRVPHTRRVAGQLPTGLDLGRFGIPDDLLVTADRMALVNLACTAEAFRHAGVEPEELLAAVHPARVANTQGAGMGGMASVRHLLHDQLLDDERQNDRLQESLGNVVAAHVVQGYVGSYGPMLHPVAACATAAVSLAEAADKIRSGQALAVVAGGYDDLTPEGMVGFGDMHATAASDELDALGLTPAEASRANDVRRRGFVEAQGGGAFLVVRGDLALALGLPVQGVLVYGGSFGDGIHTSIPAPGMGVLAAASGGPRSPLAEALRRHGLTVDDIAVVSKHDTSTELNDPNEADLHQRLQQALGRTPGNPLLVVSQKTVTGHAKGGAAAWQVAGVLQTMATGWVPGNRNLDWLDPAVRAHDHLVHGHRALRCPADEPVRAALVTSLGFGHVSALLALAHPDTFVAALPADQRDDYVRRADARRARGERSRLAVRHRMAPPLRRSDRRLGLDPADAPAADPTSAREAEAAALLDPATRLAPDGVLRPPGPPSPR
jgi:enoyl reductase-like protein/3-oxoacyl-ACP reductase-like protein/3-oxoacyl-(acyl-carrier-protein) synthase/acyl dehydratase